MKNPYIKINITKTKIIQQQTKFIQIKEKQRRKEKHKTIK